MGNFYVKKNFIVGLETSSTATLATDVPNLQQIEGLVNGVLAPLEAARLEASVNVDIVTGGLLIIDGVQTVAGDRILLTAQTDPIDNGVYVVVDGGSWTRATDVAVGVVLEPGKKIFIEEGTEHQYHEQKLAASSDVTVGTDPQTWVHAYTYNQEASATSYDPGTNEYITGVTAQAALDDADDALILINDHTDALLGVATDDLGTFTGTTIPDNQNVKQALQSLETGLENIDVSGDIATYYGSQRFEQTAVTLTASVWTTITHNLNETYPSSIAIYGEGGDLMTDAFNVEVLTANTLRIENEYPVDLTGMVVVVRV